MSKIAKLFALALSAMLLTGCGGAAASTSSGQTSQSTTAAHTNNDIIAESTALTESNIPVEATTPATEQSTAPATEVTTAPTTAATTATAPTEKEEYPVDAKFIALTFDDGPNTTTTVQVLDLLEKYDVTASFFLIGNNINDESAKVVKRAFDMGCEIHNHSKSHPAMNELSADEIIAEFTYTDDKIFEITGKRSGFFRPPYIAVSNDMLDNIDVPFIAGIGCNDWDDKVTAERRTAMILRQVKDGDIILLHDMQGNYLTVEALDTLIPELKAQGYVFVTVTELFNVKGTPISADDTKIYTNVMQEYQYG